MTKRFRRRDIGVGVSAREKPGSGIASVGRPSGTSFRQSGDPLKDRVVVGDLWEAPKVFHSENESNLILVTANSTLNKQGELVMGRGAAKEARDKFPGFAKLMGEIIAWNGYEGGLYGISIAFGRWRHQGATLGTFQVKRHYKDRASLRIIQESARRLHENTRSFKHIFLNFPGIGNGRLAYERVLPILLLLPLKTYLFTREKL